MAVTSSSNCGNCTHFEPLLADADPYKQTADTIGGMRLGVCRRYPPVPSDRINREHADLVDIMGRWPLVPDDLWCGEFKEELA